jgi:3-methyladenine DNA glycosylase AlkD
MASTTVLAALKSALSAAGNAQRAAQKAAYLKDVCKFYGVMTPVLEAMHKDVVATAALSPSDTIAVAKASLADAYHESKHLGVLTLHKGGSRLFKSSGADVFAVVEQAFESEHAADWATVDGLSTRVLGQLVLQDPATWVPRICAWADHTHRPWKLRASAVALIPASKRGLHSEHLLRVSHKVLLATADRFPQLGVGWALREAGVHHPEAVLTFVRAHLPAFNREALGYALEKTDARVRAEVLAAHKAALAAGGRAALGGGSVSSAGAGLHSGSAGAGGASIFASASSGVPASSSAVGAASAGAAPSSSTAAICDSDATTVGRKRRRPTG